MTLKQLLSLFSFIICLLGHPIVLPMVTSVKMGVSATLTCRATGVPGQKITWKRRNGQNELRIINNGKYEIISSGSGSSQLTIKHISISDHGYYVCDTSAIVNQPSSARGFLGVRCKLCAFIQFSLTNSILLHQRRVMKQILTNFLSSRRCQFFFFFFVMKHHEM